MWCHAKRRFCGAPCPVKRGNISSDGADRRSFFLLINPELRDSWWTQPPAPGMLRPAKQKEATAMAFSSIIMLPLLLLFLAIWAGLIYLLILLIRALRKYLAGRGGPQGKSGDPPHLGRGPQGPRDALPDDPGVRGGGPGGQPAGGQQMGDRHGGPQHLQPCWPWRSSSVCQRRSCCTRRPAGEYETIGIKGQPI